MSVCSENWDSFVGRPVTSRGSGGTRAHPVFGRSVNPISTRGAHYAHHITTCHPGFSDLATALVGERNVQVNQMKTVGNWEWTCSFIYLISINHICILLMKLYLITKHKGIGFAYPIRHICVIGNHLNCILSSSFFQVEIFDGARQRHQINI